ncbi:MAG: 5-(carboxyamino)imidazole ribonucleotide mutase, partial [Bifidobacterium sp.]
GILAGSILATRDATWADALAAFREELKEKVEESNAELK